MNVVFISGPHGCGKTAFMEALLEKSEVYIKDSFFLDFVNDLPAISHMSIFEKCLLRLYHRFYTAQQANLKCKKNNDNKTKNEILNSTTPFGGGIYSRTVKVYSFI